MPSVKTSAELAPSNTAQKGSSVAGVNTHPMIAFLLVGHMLHSPFDWLSEQGTTAFVKLIPRWQSHRTHSRKEVLFCKCSSAIGVGKAQLC